MARSLRMCGQHLPRRRDCTRRPPPYTPYLALLLSSLAGCQLVEPPSGSNQHPLQAETSQLETLAASLARAHSLHTETLLPDGRVVLIGGTAESFGQSYGSALPGVEIFRLTDRAIVPGGALAFERAQHTTSLLPDGRLLVAGGRGRRVGSTTAQLQNLSSAEIYDPSGQQTTLLAASMRSARRGHTAVPLPGGGGRILLLGGFDAGNQPTDTIEIYDPGTGSFLDAGRMASRRTLHTAVLLADGLVFIYGGIGGPAGSLTPLASGELYDPATGRSSALPTPTGLTPRLGHTATLLQGGQDILLTGGVDSLLSARRSLATALLYHHVTRTLEVLPQTLRTARQWHTASLLPSGLVLITGGAAAFQDQAALASTELFDPVTREFRSAGQLAVARQRHAATRLASGQILLTGGHGTSPTTAVELYTPLSIIVRIHPRGMQLATGQGVQFVADLQGTSNPAVVWSTTGGTVAPDGRYQAPDTPGTYQIMVTSVADPRATDSTSIDVVSVLPGTPRLQHTVTLLDDGRVLLTGGVDRPFTQYPLSVQSTPDLYHPATGLVLTLPSAPAAVGRVLHTATRLQGGRVLFVGGTAGLVGLDSLATTALFDPASDIFLATGSLATSRQGHSAELLADGRVLVTGGIHGTGLDTGSPLPQYLGSSELYDPSRGQFSPTGPLTITRQHHTATRLTDGRLLVVGGVNQGGPVARVELYDPATGQFSLGPLLSVPRFLHRATLLGDGRVLISGGSRAGDRNATNDSIAALEIYDPRTGRFESAGSLLTARQQHAAVLLTDGRVILLGGSTRFESLEALADVEIYNPATGRGEAAPPLRSPRERHTATALPGGQILVVGGSHQNTVQGIESYTPPALSPIDAGMQIDAGVPDAPRVDASIIEAAVLDTSVPGTPAEDATAPIDITVCGRLNQLCCSGAVCADGRICSPAGLCVLDCDDGNPCTMDVYVPARSRCDHQVAPAGVACRGAVSACDEVEVCDGVSTECPLDIASPEGTLCRDERGACDTPEFCDGQSKACPADQFLPGGIQCRAVIGFCDVAEFCTGTAPDCPTDQYAPRGQECSNLAGLCDAVEACTGNSPLCPQDAFAPPSTLCRAVAGPCDAPEFCTGTSVTCPLDQNASAGTTCRSPAGLCDAAEACTGTSPLCPPDGYLPSTVQCRAAAGICDVPEACTGASAQCPADTFVPSGTVCNPSRGLCDAAETCIGNAAACPTDRLTPRGTVCRAVAGPCDIADVCTGTNVDCPSDAIRPSGTLCRATGGICDVAERCDGLSTACPADTYAPAGTLCRTPVGSCDIAESCTGASAACPADGFASPATICRTLAGPCDVVEQCNGTGALCPADQFAPATTLCRPQGGLCDVADSCTGASAQCPADARAPAGTVCRPYAGVCDTSTEVCDGVSTVCPPDDLRPPSTVCRPSTGPCDAAENCTGTLPTCPPDQRQPAGTVCNPSQGGCDPAETCDGTNITCPPDRISPAGTVCRGAAGACDVAELCTGTQVACPVDAFAPSRTACPAAGSPYGCNGTSASCPTSCTSNANCASNSYCIGGQCVVGVCTPGQTRSYGCGLCGSQTDVCSSVGQWQLGACTNQGVCYPGQQAAVGGCGACGTYVLSCTGSCQWDGGNCVNQGVCYPGQAQDVPCGYCGTQTNYCSEGCWWDIIGYCNDPCVGYYYDYGYGYGYGYGIYADGNDETGVGVDVGVSADDSGDSGDSGDGGDGDGGDGGFIRSSDDGGSGEEPVGAYAQNICLSESSTVSQVPLCLYPQAQRGSALKSAGVAR